MKTEHTTKDPLLADLLLTLDYVGLDPHILFGLSDAFIHRLMKFIQYFKNREFN